MRDEDKFADDRALIRVIKFSSAIGLGTMAAILYSVKEVSPGFKYHISLGTAVAFLSAVGLSSVFWRVVFGNSHDLNPGLSRVRQRWLALLSIILTAATLIPFASAFKGVASDQAREMAQGTALAVLALAALGFLFWRVTRFLDEDSRRNGGAGEASSTPRR